MRKAVIDVGSNSVLLLVEEKEADGWRFVYESTHVTALGEGTKSTGLLSEASQVRTLAALRESFDAARAHGAETIRAAATMAARIAKNTPDFQRRAAEQGTPVEVLSGEEEARMGFESVANDPAFDKYDQLTIIDPGGQSTELTIAVKRERWERGFLQSFPVGTLALIDGPLSPESPGPLEILAATTSIDQCFEGLEFETPRGPAVVLGATGTNLVSIREGLATWQPDRVHGSYLTFEDISRAVGMLMPLSNAQRAQLTGMETGRERTLPGGALILERFLHAVHQEGCFVSVRGWRYALLEQ